MIIKIGKHAKERAVEKGISDEMIKLTIKRGSRVRQTDGYLSSYSYVSVAWKKISDDIYFVKTVKIR